MHEMEKRGRCRLLTSHLRPTGRPQSNGHFDLTSSVEERR